MRGGFRFFDSPGSFPERRCDRPGPSADLLTRLEMLASRERDAPVELIAHLAALDARPALYAAIGYGSLFSYCTRALRLSEDAACNRIEAARTCRRFPVILERLALGSLSLTSVRLLARHLTPENHQAVLARACGRTRREIDILLAELVPRPDVPASVRRLPMRESGHTVARSAPSAMPEQAAGSHAQGLFGAMHPDSSEGPHSDRDATGRSRHPLRAAPHRLPPVRRHRDRYGVQSSRPQRPVATACSSPSARRPMTTSGASRRFCAVRSPMAIPASSSNAPSRCCSRRSIRTSSRRPSGHGQQLSVPGRIAGPAAAALSKLTLGGPDTFQEPSNAPSGAATLVSAPSRLPREGGAPNACPWSSTTCSRSPDRDRPP
jgi:hypothetical protein